MKLWIFVILLMGVIAGGVGYYYNTTQTRIGELVENNATLVANNEQLATSNRKNLATIDELRELQEDTRENFERVQTQFQEIRAENRELRERLGRHELGALAAARPGLVEGIINNASDQATRCFEILSGSPLTERERNATSGREFNSECPFLWPGNPN